MENELKETLDQFVAEWKRELVGSHPQKRLLGKRTVVEDSEKEGKNCEEGEGSVSLVPTQTKVVHREPSPLLVLPAGRGERAVCVCAERKDVSVQSPSLLDTLLADLVR